MADCSNNQDVLVAVGVIVWGSGILPISCLCLLFLPLVMLVDVSNIALVVIASTCAVAICLYC